MALYLKYRPQSLDDLIGQEPVKELLSAAFANNKLSHAYLLVGPRGIGKTSTARILAKMVNCESNADIPCNKCDSCVSITNGSNLDLVEVDAASNRGIDDIRNLRETIKLSPTQSKKKVYIIDEVHMLTTEAFNALLKTLEEPPAHALFILATTEAHKVPETILSRVVRLDFKLASTTELLEALKKIAKAEKIDIEDEALLMLAKKGEGSFRDGEKLLDAMSSLGKKITAADLVTQMKSSDFESQMELLVALSKKQTKEGLLVLNKLEENGVNIRDFCLSLMDNLRSLLYIKNDLGIKLVKEDVGSDKYQKLSELAEGFATEGLTRALDAFQTALEKMKTAAIPTLPVELAVVEICGESQEKIEDRKLKIVVEDGESKMDKQESSGNDMTRLQEKWNFVLETIRPYNYSLEALLKSVRILDCNGGVVTLEAPYSFHQRILETPRNRDILESVLADVLEKPVRVSCSLGQRPQRVEDVANVELAGEDEVLRIATEIFNGKLVD